MRFPSLLAGSVTIVAFLLQATPVRADVTLDFNTLPTQQGWFYVPFGTPNSLTTESSAFSLVPGTTLVQDTLGNDYQTSVNAGGDRNGGNAYALPNAINPNLAFRLDIEARVTAEETELNPAFNRYGFGFIVTDGVQAFTLGLGTNVTQIFESVWEPM